MSALLVLAVAYLLGAIPFGYLLVKWKTGGDVRASGSGNIGATNVLRTTGRAAGVATLLLDIAKGYLAVWLAGRWTDQRSGLDERRRPVVMAGHAYPVFLEFKGGKAVASFVGAFLCLTPAALAADGRRLCRGGGLDSAHLDGLDRWCSDFAAWPSGLMEKPPLPVLAAAIVGGAFIIYRHSRQHRTSACRAPRTCSRFGSRKREESGDYRWRELGYGARDRARASLPNGPALGLRDRICARRLERPARTMSTCPERRFPANVTSSQRPGLRARRRRGRSERDAVASRAVQSTARCCRISTSVDAVRERDERAGKRITSAGFGGHPGGSPSAF